MASRGPRNGSSRCCVALAHDDLYMEAVIELGFQMHTGRKIWLRLLYASASEGIVASQRSEIRSQRGRARTPPKPDHGSLTTPILPGDPPKPCPELLTEEEAIRYLRLDTVNVGDPSATLRRYREMGILRATQVSKRLFYRRVELDRFLERATESNPR